MQSRIPIYGGRRPLLGSLCVIMLWSRVRVLRCRPGRGDGDDHPVRLRRIELDDMEHAVDPSRCATNVPQDRCPRSVPPDHDGGPKPLTCANTSWRHRAGTGDLRIQKRDVPKCAIWPFSGTVREGPKADPKP